jgi:predicted ABC-type sugar transport system permease subunit
VSAQAKGPVRIYFRSGYALKLLFMRVGVLPFFLIAALVVFTLASSQFLTGQNIVNVARQSVYLVLVSLGQMIVLLTGGFDLSVGTTIALTSVISAMIMISVMPAIPDSVGLIVAAGCLGAVAISLVIGLVNGTGVAVFGVSPFIMTLGVQSVGAGVALFLTGGVPVTGFPHAFGDTFGFGRIFGVPVTVATAIAAIAVVVLFLYWTRFGRHLYAVGGNVKAANLSGINTTATLLIARRIAPDGARRVRRGQSRRNDRPAIDRRLRDRRSFSSRRHRQGGERRARRFLHCPYSEWHGPHADRLVHADGSARRPAHPGGHRRSGPLPAANRGELTGSAPRLWGTRLLIYRRALAGQARKCRGVSAGVCSRFFLP